MPHKGEGAVRFANRASEDDRAKEDPAFRGIVVTGIPVNDRGFIPDHHVSDRPIMVIGVLIPGSVAGQLHNQVFALLYRHSFEPHRVHGVYEKNFAPSDRMPAYGRVARLMSTVCARRSLFGRIPAIS